MDASWLERHRQTISVVAVAVAFLSLGFTLGSRFGKSFGDAAAARSAATATRAQKIAEECFGLMQRTGTKPAAGPASDSKPN